MSGKSNSVSGNYTCRVGLVQTQLRCKTRGATCIHRLPLSTPLTHRCVVHCSNPPHFHFLSPSLSLSFLLLSHSFFETRMQQPHQSERTKILQLKRYLMEHCPPLFVTWKDSSARKWEIASPCLTLSVRAPAYPETLHEYIHYMFLKCQLFYMKNNAMLHGKLLNPSAHLTSCKLMLSNSRTAVQK